MTVEASDGELPAQSTFSIEVTDAVERSRDGEGNEYVVGTAGDDEIDGGDGNDTLEGGFGADMLSGGAGADIFAGTLAEFDRDTIEDFSGEDVLSVQGASLPFDGLDLLAEPVRLVIEDGNGGSATVSLGEDLQGGGFMLSRTAEGTTEIRYVDDLVSLNEGERVADADINGIANADYLSGDNSSSFTVTLQASGAAFQNILGSYEIAEGGTISAVQVIAYDTSIVGNSVTVEDVDAGSTLGFFLIQDGASRFAKSDLTDLAIDSSSGTAVLTSGGSALDAKIFVSHDPSLNVDAQQHVLSGAADDGSGSLRLGFEDLERQAGAPSDDDFQDVVFQVEAIQPVDAIGI